MYHDLLTQFFFSSLTAFFEFSLQEYAETAMNELLGWYGYDKVDSRDTQGLNLHHFAANKIINSRRSPSDADSSDVEGARSSSSPGRRDGSSQGSPPLPGNNKTKNYYSQLVREKNPMVSENPK